MKFKNKLVKSLRIFSVLMYKSLVVRKRHWIFSVVGEILVPLGLMLWVWMTSNEVAVELKIVNETLHESQSTAQLIDQMCETHKEILYSPSNPFTDKLMIKAKECLRNKFNVTGFYTKFEVLEEYFNNPYYPQKMRIIFDKLTDESTKNLHYQLQYLGDKLIDLYYNKASYYIYRNIVQIQICLDWSYFQMKSNNTVVAIPQISIQRMPHPMHIAPKVERKPFYRIFLVADLVIPSFVAILMATKEKFVGLNVLMSMNGIPSTFNWLSWIISGLLSLSMFCTISVLAMVYLPIGYSLPFMTLGNPYIIFVILIFHYSHFLTFGIHLSAYFSKSFHLIFALILINVFVLTLRFFVLQIVHTHIAPYMGIIFPISLLYQVMEEIDAYELIGIGIQWNNLFVNAIPSAKIGGSIGMIMVLSVLGTFINFWLAIYAHAIKPGKYGIGRHPFFFLMGKNKQKDERVVNLAYEDKNNVYFEPTITRNYTAVIQIRNLKMTYDISLFKKEKVHALRGVSIDFYKGQITSILGHNGAGKSTLLSILTGLISPTEGLILVNTKKLEDSACEALKDVNFYAQEDIYFPSLTVSQQLEFFARLKSGDECRCTIKSNVENFINKLKLSSVKDSLPKKLSEDQKRKLCLGMAFVGNPSILILDEPTSRLDQENKRLIWDILLEMKGRTTVLISTHDMEEADILGDRIAIMHEGRIKSYGTPLFLKKMIGGQSNIEITLSIERWSDPEGIRNQFHNESTIIEKQDKKIIISVPISSSLPESLKNLEEKKKDLGVTSYNLSHVGLEQVFLKLAEDCDTLSEPHETISSNEKNLTGFALFIQMIRALFLKKLICSAMDLQTILTQIFALFIALLSITAIFSVFDYILDVISKTFQLQLDLYYNPHTIYTSFNQHIGNQYKSVSKSFGATTMEITNKNLDNELLNQAKKDLVLYTKYLIAAAEFNKTTNGSLIANAFYSDTISFSLPISINLVSNTIVKNLLGVNYSITISEKSIPYKMGSMSMIMATRVIGQITAVIFAIPIFLLIAMFAAHPNRESTKGIKHLQKMTGVSGLTYWATMFVADLMYYSILVVFIVFGLICIDYYLKLQLYGITESMIMVLLLMLFAINVLPMVYSFSFIKTKTNFVLKFFTMIPIGIVIVDVIMFVWRGAYSQQAYLILRAISLVLPYMSFLHGQMQLHSLGILNAVCRKPFDDFYAIQCKYDNGYCCKKNCLGKKCRKFIPYLLDDDVDSLNMSVIYLCTMPLLYFGILTILEGQIIQKIKRKCTKQEETDSHLDEKINFEKTMISRKIPELKNNRLININKQGENSLSEELFLAYELRKYYRNVKAVENVSFRIRGYDCFGLFGANRSGKSTTMRIISGEEISDDGIMYIGDIDFKNNKKRFLSQMGYCRQYDATLKCLNAYDHLRMFARLRGIPEDQVQNEVQVWIDRLNLNAYALQPSGTLSSGNNQRLNIAMALVGNPNLVLLDEPTTRMDPGARRLFWSCLKSRQMAGQTFLLASHNMEECKALCRRTVIMVDGKLICIGTPTELKQRFGAGYDVQIRINSTKINKNILDRIKKDMRLLMQCVLTNENSGYLMYHVIGAGTTWSKIYEVMGQIKNKYDCVDDFLVVVRLST